MSSVLKSGLSSLNTHCFICYHVTTIDTKPKKTFFKKKHNHGFSLMFQPWPSPVVDSFSSFYITVLPRLIENEETWAHVAHVSLTVSLLPSPFHLFVIDSCRTLRIPVTLFLKNILKVKKAFYKLCRFCSFYRIQLGKTEKV